MNITPVSVPQATAHDSTTSGSSGGLPTPQGLNNMFLQLLVAQLKNQSPLNPMDPTQFVGQLAQFSELSEVTQIDQTLQQLVSSGSDSTGSVPPASGGSAPPTKPELATTPDAISSAVAAAERAVRGASSTDSPVQSILNPKIQGVF